ncbi:carboxymuconolactone decarboxylase family protein [Caulobacter sp. KR2-114]|uniref:carboxymuconolactone decarboxylase family protein n=1 Tax=Caulobacter sp. KR2-114 TaxID=3400912 RepID=UPI003BFB783F
MPLLNPVILGRAPDRRAPAPEGSAGRLRSAAVQFGDFTYLPGQALLLRDGVAQKIGSRALDILDCLLANAGQLVEKAELARWVWPTTTVEEVSIRVHLAALRKVLGDGRDGARFIINVPGRGYRFVAPVRRAALAFAPDPEPCQAWDGGPRLAGEDGWAADRLDGRTRELVALVAAACLRRDGAVGLHVAAAQRLGVGPEEIAEALRLAAAMESAPAPAAALHLTRVAAQDS